MTASQSRTPSPAVPCRAEDNQKLRDGERWYVAYTQPRREREATLHLENQGFRTFLPHRLRTVRHARKLQTKLAAFFPRYAFVALDLGRQRWRSVNGTVGVVSLVMNGNAPAPVPPSVVETLIASTDARGLLCFEPALQAGERVRLVAGPFADQLGILERVGEDGSVRVLLDIMGGRVPLRLASEHVARAA